LRRGAAWLFAGRGIDRVLHFASGVVLARLLAPEHFGMLLTIQIYTGVAGLVSGGGMGQALVRAKSATQADYDIVFTLQLAIGCVICTLFFVTAPLFAHWYDTPLYKDLIRVSALNFVFRPLINVPLNILFRQQRFGSKTVIALATLIASSAVSIAMAWWGLGVWSLIWGGIAGAFVQAVLLAWQARWRPGLSTEFRRGRELAGYGFLVSANDIVDYLRQRVSTFMLSQHIGAAGVGLYNKGESLAQMPFLFVSGSAYQVLFRAMASEQDNLDKCRYLFAQGVRLVAVYGTPFYVGLAWLAEPLVRGVYGEKWVEAAQPLLVLLVAWPFMVIENMSGAVAAALNLLRSEVQIHSANVFVTALAIMIALPFGITGVAWAMVGATVFSCVFLYRLACAKLGIPWWYGPQALLPAALLNAGLAAALFAVEALLPAMLRDHNLMQVAVVGAAGALVYALLFLSLPIPSLAGERRRWRSRIGFPERSTDT
jgi:O-antigen/teichoic acid export membrane protein